MTTNTQNLCVVLFATPNRYTSFLYLVQAWNDFFEGVGVHRRYRRTGYYECPMFKHHQWQKIMRWEGLIFIINWGESIILIVGFEIRSGGGWYILGIWRISYKCLHFYLTYNLSVGKDKKHLISHHHFLKNIVIAWINQEDIEKMKQNHPRRQKGVDETRRTSYARRLLPASAYISDITCKTVGSAIRVWSLLVIQYMLRYKQPSVYVHLPLLMLLWQKRTVF